ncbi:MAG TPA: hypothetical protein VL359_06735, partial [bacterium]|nr:hypothetical protein [bacterium]
MIQATSLPADPLDMPDQYFQRTTPAEQERHRHKLAHLTPQSWLVEEVPPAEGGAWTVELVTMDWDEPGLLDRIFEAILRCINIPEGVQVRRARIFTGRGGQVVNLLELESHQGQPLTPASRELVLQELGRIRRGERGVLDTIQHFPFSTPVPLVTGVPSLDNGRSPDYTYLELEVERLSNRFTSVLLHFLARSELWLNIQVAEFTQGPRARYAFYVVDKHGRKLRDSHFVRHR